MHHQLRRVVLAVALACGVGVFVQVPGGGQAQTGATADPVLVGAGDIAPDCLAGGSLADAEATAQLLDNTPGTVFTIGDNTYDTATLALFNSCYDPTWGRHKARTYPASGNHEYETAGAEGYFDYFNGIGNQTGRAGDRSKGYYSYNIGSWHVVVLNSECGSAGLWNVNGCAVGSPQEQWLRADLAASTTNNILAIFHKPRFSSGWKESAVDPLWKALFEYGADLVLNGHVHNYERLAPAGASGARDNTYGIRQIVVGTGGVPLIPTASTKLAISEVTNSTAHGVMKLTLHSSSYEWEFVPTAGDNFTDSGTAAVHGPPPPGLVGSWQMEEGGGSTLVDSSPFQNNAAIKGSPTWIPGRSGLALDLDGSADYAVAPNSSTLNASKLTLSLWVNPSKVALQYLLKRTSAYELDLSSGGRPLFRLNGNNTYRIEASTAQVTGAWMHLAGTYDGTTMRLYVNGVEQGQGIPGPSAIAAPTAPLGIGAGSDGSGKLQGALDDVRIYTRVLSLSEIRALAGNLPPDVDAGPDQVVTASTLPASASLTGTASDDGLPDPPGAVTTTWSAVSGPGAVTFANASATSTTANFSTAGTYVLKLTAYDGMLTSSDTMTVTVNTGSGSTNQAPVVNAGADQTIVLPASATLSGTVTDDGLPNPPKTVTVAWSKVSGPGTVTFGDAAATSTTATFSTAGTYVLQLSASDSVLTTTDTVTIVVTTTTTTTGPVGYWKMDEGSGTQLLDASGRNNTGAIKGSPTWVAGKVDLGLNLNGTTDYAVVPDSSSLNPARLTLAMWVNPSRKALQYLVRKSGAYELDLSASGRALLRLNGNNTYRIDASTAQVNGTWMHVAGTYDGTTLRLYVNGVEQGQGIPGPSTIAASTSPLSIGAVSNGTSLLQGVLDEVRVYDRALSAAEIQSLAGATAPGNTAPTVSAGTNQTIAYGTTATLNGTVTDDGLPDPPGTVTTNWSQVSGPGTTTFANAAAIDTTATFSAAGSYVLQLSASDSALSSNARVTVTVNSPTSTNQAPVVNAGADQTIVLPASATLSGTVTDDGLPNPPNTVTVAWSKVSGPGTVTFGNAAATSTTATFSTAGTYVLQLSASDSVLTTTDTVTIVTTTTTTTGPVGYWKMDEGSGTQLLDASGRNNTGAIKGSPTWVAGKAGLALNLNGTTDYAVVPDSPSLNPARLTVAMWVNPARLALTYVVRKAGAYELDLSATGRPLIRLNGDNIYRIDASTAQVNGTWMHVAGTYDGTTMHLYVNGVEQGQGLPGPAAIAASTSPLSIGGVSNGTSLLQGAVDEVRIYDRALSASEIQALAAGTQALVAGAASATLARAMEGGWSTPPLTSPTPTLEGGLRQDSTHVSPGPLTVTLADTATTTTVPRGELAATATRVSPPHSLAASLSRPGRDALLSFEVESRPNHASSSGAPPPSP